METLKHYGGEIKALGDGRIAGWAVRFTGPGDTDLEGDFFTADTRFGKAKEVDLYYDHGFDQTLKRRPVGDATLEAKDAGLWLEGQLSLRDEYERAIYELVESGKAAFSSGAVGHLVERENTGKGNWIKSWPIGEVSITMTPAEPRATAQAAKTAQIGETEAPDEADQPEAPEAKGAAPARTEVKPDSESITHSKSTTMEQENTSNTGAPKFDVEAAFKQLNDRLEANEKAFNESKTDTVVKATALQTPTNTAPAVIMETGDNEVKAFSRWVRTGDMGGVKHMQSGEHAVAIKASNDTDMNIGTAADGGNAVQQDMADRIVARRDEMRLSSKIGVRRFTGTATTLDVPTDNEPDGEWVSTAEAAAFDRDAPALGQTVLTLTKYTKKIQLSYELLQDTNTNLTEFLTDFVARGQAKTHNNLLITESVANGTILKTTASGTVAALGELEDAAYTNDLAEYLDGPNSGAWIMAPATYGKILSIGGTSNRYYAPTAQGSPTGPTLLGFPVEFSQKVDAYGTADNDWAHFAAWNDYMALYESPEFEFLRDPYGSANTGQVNLFYYFRADYGVLQSEAGGFVRHLST